MSYAARQDRPVARSLDATGAARRFDDFKGTGIPDNILAARLKKLVAHGVFAEPSLGHLWLQMLVRGAVFPVLGIANDTCVALGASTLRTWFARSPRRLEVAGGTGGLAMIAVGAGFLINARKD